MRYLGGKSRLARKFAPILDDALARGSGRFVEPFVGAFNVVPALAKAPASAACSDAHPGLVVMLRAVQSGWSPPTELSEDDYRRLRAAADWSDPATAFAAFGCSFGAKEWGGYAVGTGRNYAAEAESGLLKKRERMGAVEFSCMHYGTVEAGSGDVVYCDPPYAGTTGYRTGAWSPEPFYAWCEEQARRGARVFVSEFTAPSRPGWGVVWSLERDVTVGFTRNKKVDLLMEVRP